MPILVITAPLIAVMTCLAIIELFSIKKNNSSNIGFFLIFTFITSVGIISIIGVLSGQTAIETDKDDVISLKSGILVTSVSIIRNYQSGVLVKNGDIGFIFYSRDSIDFISTTGAWNFDGLALPSF